MASIIKTVFTLFIFFLTILWLTYQFSKNTQFLDAKKGLEKYNSISMQVSMEEFMERIEEQNRNNNYFHSIIAGDSFILRYLPPGSSLFGMGYWTSLKGLINDGLIYYEFTGLFSFRNKTYERERLLKNVTEFAGNVYEMQK